MASSYHSFMVLLDPDDGTFPPAPGVTVKVYDVTHSAALADTAADGDGVVPGATVAVDPGTLLRFSVHRADSYAGCAEQVTV
jgi:hypothetical protein